MLADRFGREIEFAPIGIGGSHVVMAQSAYERLWSRYPIPTRSIGCQAIYLVHMSTVETDCEKVWKSSEYKGVIRNCGLQQLKSDGRFRSYLFPIGEMRNHFTEMIGEYNYFESEGLALQSLSQLILEYQSRLPLETRQLLVKVLN